MMVAAIARGLNVLALALLGALGVMALIWAIVYSTEDFNWWLLPYAYRLGELPVQSQYALAALMILLPIFVGSLQVRLGRQEPMLTARTAEGDEIRLTERAVKKVIRKAMMAFPEVASVTSSATSGKKGPVVVVRARVRVEADIPKLQKQMKVRASAALRQLLGVGEIELIRIVIAGVVFPPKQDGGGLPGWLNKLRRPAGGGTASTREAEDDDEPISSPR